MKAKSPASDFGNIINRLAPQQPRSKVFASFTRLAACALAAQTREAEYLEEIKHWKRDDLQLFAEALAALTIEMESKPFEDVIGQHYLESSLSRQSQQWHGEFHTPKPVCDLKARLTLGDMSSFPAEGHINVCEPACGAGAMILSFAQACPPEARRRLRVTAVDINRTACNMTFINTTLWGIPTRVIHGNSLSMEYWAAWSNVHLMMPWLPLTVGLPSPEAMKQGNPPAPAEVARLQVALGQLELGF